jgi:hypothetical protein
MVFTDTATYRLDFVGPPFTFSIRKVASNAGLIGQHAAVYANGACGGWVQQEDFMFMMVQLNQYHV